LSPAPGTMGDSAEATRTFGVRKGAPLTVSALGDRRSPPLSIFIPNARGILRPVPRLAAAGRPGGQ